MFKLKQLAEKQALPNPNSELKLDDFLSPDCSITQPLPY